MLSTDRMVIEPHGIRHRGGGKVAIRIILRAECGGSGRVLSIATICLNLRREILNRTGHLGDHKLVVTVHPEVEAALRSDQHEVYEELDELLGEQLELEPDPDLAHDHYSIVEA